MIYLYYILLGVLVSLPFLNILLIYRNIIKRAKIQEKSDVIALWGINFNLILSIFSIILSIILFKIFLIRYFEAYSILIPDYLNKWYQMFDYNSMLTIKNTFFQKFITIHELITINMFMGLGLKTFSSSIMCLSLAISNLYRGLQRKTISTKGIYYLGKSIKWVEIVEYEWKCLIKKNNINHNIEYYKLSLYVKNDKFTKWFLSENTSKHTLKISSHDKEKVNFLINNNNINLINNNKTIGI
ncbi:hypothetical protein [Clostridium sp.]|jgi:hypothetical protein|uniref:hypothetical protein n=1 Tax=Clostridium sp. TaxID=1506 RepID=UPI003EE86F2E